MDYLKNKYGQVVGSMPVGWDYVQGTKSQLAKLGVVFMVKFEGWESSTRWVKPITAKIAKTKDCEKVQLYLSELAKKKSNKKPVSEQDLVNQWAKRLVTLSGIAIDDAIAIAQAKIDYKEKKISEIVQKQMYGMYSSRRQKLIDRMERENPLRRIVDANHATAIMDAHRRHTETDYEDRLDEGRELIEDGLLEQEELREFARRLRW